MLVQPAGWGQLGFNLLGIAVVGAAFERRRPRWQWVLTYVLAGVGSVVLLALLRPDDHGGGSSDGVAGLIGALAVAELLERARRPSSRSVLDTVAMGYSAFFCAYLAALPLGVWPAIIAGDVALALALTVRYRVGPAGVAVGGLVLVVVTGAVMAVQADGHGIGLLTGAVTALVVWRARSRE